MRNIGYQNSFLPVLFGRVEPASGGCRLRFRLGLHPVVAVMMVGLVPSVALMSRYSPSIPSWVLGVMLGFPVVGTVVSYLWEGPKLLRLVADCLEVDPGELGL